jgi:hypothetical protein
MTQPEMPDGQYIRWLGRIRPALNTSFRRKTVLVGLEPGEEAPARYQRYERNDRAIYVPMSELEEHFDLTTYCQWNGMRCQVEEWTAPDRILIDAALIGSDRAAELGMTPTYEREQFVKEVPVSEVTDLHQERHDYLRS